MKIIDFKKYRTKEALEAAMMQVLDAKVVRRNRVKAVCPRRECRASEKPLLMWNPDWPVAYCFRCHNSIDALDIVRLSRNTDYFGACEILESFSSTG